MDRSVGQLAASSRPSIHFASIAVATALLIAACASATPDNDTSTLRNEARTASVEARTAIGFSPGGDFRHLSDDELAEDLDNMITAGATWIRIDVDWSVVEVDAGHYQWESTDRLIAAARQRGLQVLGMLAYTPHWARPEGSEDKVPPTDPAMFARFTADAVARYGPMGVTAWEIWNEPNSALFWMPKPDPDEYARLLVASADAMRAVDDDITIVTGGLAPAVDDPDGRSMAPITFLAELYDSLGNAADAIGVHPYSFPASPFDAETAGWNTFYQLPELYEELVELGATNTSIWLTEYGAPTGTSERSVAESDQAVLITDALLAVDQWSWAGPIFLYTLRDPRYDPPDLEANFGLIRADGTPKPAWEMLVASRR